MEIVSESEYAARMSRYIAALFLTIAWAIYTENKKSPKEANAAHLNALEACAAFENQAKLVQNGIMKPVSISLLPLGMLEVY